MKKYYSEAMDKDTSYRAEFLSGIECFLQRAKEDATKKREAFITPQLYKENPESYREKFLNMLGFPLTEKREMPTVEKTFVTQDLNVDIYRLTFSFTNGLRYYGLYFKQTENTKVAPFVFGFHGGAGTPELVSSLHLNSTNYNHLVRRLTDMGANVFAPQLLLWRTDDYGNAYDRLETDGRLRQLGGCVTALEIYLMQCALDYFIANEEVNEDKIGVAGMSYGGMYALHFAAVDTRVKACYSCSFVCDVFQWVKDDWSYQNAQNTFGIAETAALIAPRPLVVAMGLDDPAYQKGTDIECERIVPYYTVFNQSKNFKYCTFQGSHEVDKSDEELLFLLKALQE